MNSLDFPHDAVDKNPPANAGDMGLILFGKIPHAMKQLCRCATTAEPVLSSYSFWAHELQLLSLPSAITAACAPQRRVAPAHCN